ncbi:MAG: OmpH family outer membrane protein [Thermodesulfovibrionia bacterium]|nr:OmpH family outer membrane protein [Thermodesulfovibrionia bacterium]
MKKIVIVAIVAVMLFCANSYAAEKVGFINVQKIVSDSEMGKKANADIQKLKDTENVKITKRRAEFEELNKTFKAESQKEGADQAELKLLIDKIQLKEKEFKRIVDDAKEMLAKKDRDLVIDILLKADPILKDIAKTKGYAMIFRDRNALAYLDPAVDITDEVIKKLDKK